MAVFDDGVARDGEIVLGRTDDGRQVRLGDPAAIGRGGDARTVLPRRPAVQDPREGRLRIAVGRGALEPDRVVDFGLVRPDDRHPFRRNCGRPFTRQLRVAFAIWPRLPIRTRLVPLASA